MAEMHGFSTPTQRRMIGHRKNNEKQKHTLLVLSLEFSNKVVDETVVEVFTTQVSVTGSGLDFEDTLFNSQERDIEGTTTEIENKNVTLSLSLLVKTVGNSSGGGLVDDTEDVKTGDKTSILGGLTLRVVEVGRNSDNYIQHQSVNKNQT